MTLYEYEERLDKLKGACRDNLEWLIEHLDDLSNAYDNADADYCLELARICNDAKCDFESLVEDFENLEDKRYEDEEED